MSDLVTSRERIHITNQLIRLAHVTAHNAHKRLIDGTTICEFHDRDVEPFFVHASSIRTKTAPTNIHDMRGAGEEPHMFTIMKRRGNHGNIVQVARTFPRVVSDVDITVTNVRDADPTYEMRDSIGHGVDVTGCACDRLCEHLTADIIDPSGKITRFTHRGGKGCAHKGLRLFFDNRNEAVPHDLVSDVGRGLAHDAAPLL